MRSTKVDPQATYSVSFLKAICGPLSQIQASASQPTEFSGKREQPNSYKWWHSSKSVCDLARSLFDPKQTKSGGVMPRRPHRFECDCLAS